MKQEEKIKIGRFLKDYRMSAGLTLQDVSKIIGKQISTIKSYECGAREPNVTVLLLMSSAYDVSIDELVGNPRGDYDKRNPFNPETRDLKDLMNAHERLKKAGFRIKELDQLFSVRDFAEDAKRILKEEEKKKTKK